ncbi:retrovirus-related pol polyprotein from transposon TNT 1-94 [Tanacetum coccineum]
MDYKETLYQIARFDTIRVILALVAQNQWKVFQFDEKSAFLNGDLQEKVHVSSSVNLLSEFKRSMMNMFDMTNLGELHYFLGLELVQTNGGIFMSYRKYIEDTLQKFNMVGNKIAVTPINISEKLESQDGTTMVDESLFKSLIRRLLCLTHSCPDISYHVYVISRFMNKLSKHHNSATKRVLRYLAGTKDFCICSLMELFIEATIALSSAKAELHSGLNFSLSSSVAKKNLG